MIRTNPPKPLIILEKPLLQPAASTALEMRHTRKGIVGSNPTLSANFLNNP